MERKPGGTYFYLVLLFSVVVLAYSIWVLFSAFSHYQEGRLQDFYFGLIAGAIGMALAASSLATMRRRFAFLREMDSRVSSVILCDKCGFKVVRAFGAGDYVHKDVGKCQQCDGTMFINCVYAEVPSKKPL